MGRVFVAGSFNLDMVVRTDRAPKPGETVLGRDFFTTNGGKGANQAVAAARMGAQVIFAGRVGDDSNGRAAIESLKQEKIDVTHLSRDPKYPTGIAMIVLNDQGENQIIVAPGANEQFSDEKDLSACTQAIHESDVTLVQLEIPPKTVEILLGKAHAAGKMTILNPAPARALPRSIFKNLTLITPNETEAESLTGVAVTDDASAGKAAEILHQWGVETVIITLGQRGAFVSQGKLCKTVPAIEAKVVDTTAAGDVFSGALAAALSDRTPILEAVQFACKAASLSVSRLGAQSSIPFANELH